MNKLRASWVRTFLIIFSGQAFSLLGSFAVSFALVWWLTVKTGSATILAWAMIMSVLPQALLSPIVGPFIDRWDRRWTMIGADIGIALTSVVLIAVFAAGEPTPAWIFVAIVLRSAGAAFHAPASQAAVPMYVPVSELTRVAGWNYFLTSGMAMAGPVFGAFLMGVAPMGAVLGVDVAGALIATTSLLLVRIPHPERAQEEVEHPDMLREMAAGWHELVRYRGLIALTVLVTIAAFLYMPVGALFPLMTLQHFGGGAFDASMVEFAFGGGMLVGSLIVGKVTNRLGGTRVTLSGIGLLGITLLVSGLLPRSAFVVFVAACIVMGFTAPLFSAPVTAIFQATIDPAKLGRVMSLFGSLTLLATPLGLVAAGPLAQQLGVALWFAISGVLILLTGILAFLSPTIAAIDRPTKEMDGSAAAENGVPATPKPVTSEKVDAG